MKTVHQHIWNSSIAASIEMRTVTYALKIRRLQLKWTAVFIVFVMAINTFDLLHIFYNFYTLWTRNTLNNNRYFSLVKKREEKSSKSVCKV